MIEADIIYPAIEVVEKYSLEEFEESDQCGTVSIITTWKILIKLRLAVLFALTLYKSVQFPLPISEI